MSNTKSLQPVEVAAWAYMSGHRFGIDDEGDLLLIIKGQPDPALVAACNKHLAELRDMVLTGIRNAINGYQPALDGLQPNR